MVEYVNRGSLQQAPGTDRKQSNDAFSELDMLRLALNQVDYGLVAVDVDTGTVQFANSVGRDALEDADERPGNPGSDTGLCLVRGRVAARSPHNVDLLFRTLARTRLGLRGLLYLGSGDQSASVAVVPLHAPKGNLQVPAPAGAAADVPSVCLALLVFGKQQLCDDSSMALFARERGLTSAEGQVLAKVCRGLRPAEIADNHGVQISTVRTQLRSIRLKTCSETIRELVQKVSVLPPMALHLSARSPALA